MLIDGIDSLGARWSRVGIEGSCERLVSLRGIDEYGARIMGVEMDMARCLGGQPLRFVLGIEVHIYTSVM